MRNVSRPDAEPVELTELRQQGGEDFGRLGWPLDRTFGGVCAYCEREPLWRTTEDGLGIQDTDLPDEPNLLFTCDHFRPRHLFPGLIYDWNNLVYACPACNGVKGGQWPGDADEADSYIDPCSDPSSAVAPDSVFDYDLDTGEIKIRDGLTGVAGANAQKTIDDLALNHFTDQADAILRNTRIRRVDLATYRQQRARRVKEMLEIVAPMRRDLIPALIAGFVSPSARFSSICRKRVEKSGYGHYLI